jgi:transposase
VPTPTFNIYLLALTSTTAMTVALRDDENSSGKRSATIGAGSASRGRWIAGSTTTTRVGDVGNVGHQSISCAVNMINKLTDDHTTTIEREPVGRTIPSSSPKASSDNHTNQTSNKVHNGFISDELRGFVIDKLNSEYVVPNPLTGELELRRGAYCQVGQLIGKSHGTVKNIWLNREADHGILREQRRHRKDTTAAEKDTMVYDLLLGATKDEQTGKITVKKGSFMEMAMKFNVTESTVRRIFKVAEHEYKSGRGFQYPHDRKINSGSGKKRIMTIDQFKEIILTVPRGQRTIPNMARAIKASESTVAAYLHEAPYLNMLVDCALGSRRRKPKDKEIYRDAILSLPRGGRKCMAVAKVMGISDSAVRDFVRLDGNEDLLALIDSKRGLTGRGERHGLISTENLDEVKKLDTRVWGRTRPFGGFQTTDIGYTNRAPAGESPLISAKRDNKSSVATGAATLSKNEREKATLANSIDTTTPIRATAKKSISKLLTAKASIRRPKKSSRTAKVSFRVIPKVLPATSATKSTIGIASTKHPPTSIIDDVPEIVERTANNDYTAVDKDNAKSAMLTRQKELQAKLVEIQTELAKINAALVKSQDVTLQLNFDR